MLFEDIYKNFLKYASTKHKKQGYITLKNCFDNNILIYFKNKEINKITKQDILNWKESILNRNFSNKYNNKIYYTFKSFLAYCVEFNYLKTNYFDSISNFPKKIEIKQHQVYTLNQFRKFRKNINDYVIKQYFNFIYFYGTRPGETMALTFKDVKRNYIRVIHNLNRKGKRELDSPKNQASVRAFKISYLMTFRIYLLKRYYLKKYNNFNDNYFIFGGIKPLAPTTIDRVKKLAYTKAKLPSITQHEFRHSYATRMIHNKKSIDFVSRSMGHSKVSTTLDIYLHQEKNTLLNVFNS